MTTTKATAQDLFRAAYENRYTWDNNFPGYTAEITFKDGEQVFTGKTRISSDLKAEVFDVDNEQAQKSNS